MRLLSNSNKNNDKRHRYLIMYCTRWLFYQQTIIIRYNFIERNLFEKSFCLYLFAVQHQYSFGLSATTHLFAFHFVLHVENGVRIFDVFMTKFTAF